jgi:hypothetical protein
MLDLVIVQAGQGLVVRLKTEAIGGVVTAIACDAESLRFRRGRHQSTQPGPAAIQAGMRLARRVFQLLRQRAGYSPPCAHLAGRRGKSGQTATATVELPHPTEGDQRIAAIAVTTALILTPAAALGARRHQAAPLASSAPACATSDLMAQRAGDPT